MGKVLDKFPAVLLLEDGTFYHGTSIGKMGTATGEICFNTGMTGYQEVFTDPSYFGQILVETNVHIGNYGVTEKDTESGHIKIAGLVCKNFNVPHSRKMANATVQDYFSQENIVGIADIDTRELVRHIRDKGAMNAVISSEELDVEKLKEILKSVPSMEGLELSSRVTTENIYYMGEGNTGPKVAVLDLGVKRNILKSLESRGCQVAVFPGNTSYSDMMKWNPDGFLISNGPGDPAMVQYAVETTGEILKDNKAIFGICLGHQILAQANGVSTLKMHNGHRGLNHPVKNLLTGNCEITSQNHGFTVNPEDVKKNPNIEITHINLNDNTIEGIRIKGKKAFSVQYHPEASPGPHDAAYLFDDFIKLINS